MLLLTNPTQVSRDEIEIQDLLVKNNALARRSFLKGSLGASSAALLDLYVQSGVSTTFEVANNIPAAPAFRSWDDSRYI
ncbi:MAG: hypothetical protein ABIP64_03490 [Burkholderiales bacterium]